MKEKDFMADMARKMLQKCLERNNGNIEAAAKEMGVSTETLLRRLEQNGIKF